jgi:uncharacterized protein YuzE
MKIRYSADVDALYITLKDTDIAESDEISDGVIVDYDRDENVVGIEILWISEKADISQLIIQAIDKDKVKFESSIETVKVA